MGRSPRELHPTCHCFTIIWPCMITRMDITEAAEMILMESDYLSDWYSEEAANGNLA